MTVSIRSFVDAFPELGVHVIENLNEASIES
jgi:hypothetical protein